MAQSLLLVVGSLNYDLILRSDRLPAAGETITGAVLTESCGGKGANQAVAAARFSKSLEEGGPRVCFAGAVGDDLFGQRQLDQLQADGVDISGVRRIDGVSTGTSTIWVDSTTGENRILNAPGANLRYLPDQLSGLPFGAANLVLIQNEIGMATTRRVCELAANHDVPMIWDPAPFPPGTAIPLTPSDVRYATPNETEAEALLDRPLRPGNEEDVRDLQALGFGTVVLTLGARGVAVADREGRFYCVAAPAANAVDTTGAGDAFSGAFAASLLAGTGEEEAIRRGVAYATSSVCHPGAQTSFPIG